MNYTQIFKKNWEVVAISVAVMVVLALLFTVVQQFQYRSTVQLLVIQKQTNNIDAYTADKSAERIAKNLAQVIYASSFYNPVIDSNSEIKAMFPSDPIERRKILKQDVETKLIPETGILEIAVYNENKDKAALVVSTLANALLNQAGDYHGGGEDVEVKLIDEAFTSKYPVRPNIALNLILAFIFGLVFGNAFAIIREARVLNKVKPEAIADSFIEPEPSAPILQPLSDLSQLIPKDELVQVPVLAEETEMANSADSLPVNGIVTMYDHL